MIRSAVKDVAQLKLSCNPGGKITWYNHFGKQLAVSFTVKHILTINLVIPLLSIYQTEIKTSVHTKTCMPMIIERIFIITPTWKQPKCLPTGELINMLQDVCIIEHYSAIK